MVAIRPLFQGHRSFSAEMPKFVQLPVLISMINVIDFVVGMDGLKQSLLQKDATDQQSQFELFVEDGTTEEEDMEKAMKTGKTFFWREMMTNWHCKNGKLKKLEEIGIKKFYKDLVEFCKKWKMMATAANAFVKSWERKGQKVDTSSSRNSRKTSKFGERENPLECLCLKPHFHVDNRELQMSSAMEAIKAVYRDLFKWGDGKSIKIELKLANDKPWKVIQFLVIHSNGQEIKASLTELEKSPSVGVKKFDDFMAKNFPKIHLNVSAHDIFSSAFCAAINDENNVKSDEEEQKCDQFVESCFKFFDQLANLDILKRKELQKEAFQMYIELWEISNELGLDITKICEADIEFAENYANASMFYQPWYLFRTRVVRTKDFLMARVNGHLLPYRTIEQMVGNWHYQFKELVEEEWHNVNAKENANANANNDEEDEQLEQQLPNPCEEAKLRVKK